MSPLSLASLNLSLLRLHPCQDILLEDTIITLEHLTYKVVDRISALELVASALLLDQLGY